MLSPCKLIMSVKGEWHNRERKLGNIRTISFVDNTWLLKGQGWELDDWNQNWKKSQFQTHLTKSFEKWLNQNQISTCELLIDTIHCCLNVPYKSKEKYLSVPVIHSAFFRDIKLISEQKVSYIQYHIRTVNITLKQVNQNAYFWITNQILSLNFWIQTT